MIFDETKMVATPEALSFTNITPTVFHIGFINENTFGTFYATVSDELATYSADAIECLVDNSTGLTSVITFNHDSAKNILENYCNIDFQDFGTI